MYRPFYRSTLEPSEESYTPEYCKDISVKYHVINPGEPSGQFYPGCDPEIEIFEIEIKGQIASPYMYALLIETHEFELEILDRMKRGVAA